MKTRIIAVLCILIAALFSAASLSAVELYAIQDVYPGLKGIGKTVIEGTKIEEFQVEVIDVIPEGGFDGGPMITARFSGDVIEHSNGIAGGYSGSPVYFDGKLAGAVSSAIPFSDTHIGGITPITSMLAALDTGEEADISDVTVLPPAYTQFSTGPGGPVIHTDSEAPPVIWTYDRGYAKRMNEMRSGTLYAVPLEGTLLFKGISPRTFAKVAPILDSNPLFKNIMPVRSTSGAGPRGYGLLKDKGDVTALEPGDALAVALVTGDYDLAAVGTLTYKDDEGRILAFGHPFFGLGNVSMPFGKAYIVYTHTSIMRGFKDGYMIGQSGTITQDHMAAVGGVIGMEPDMVDVHINIKDLDRRRTRRFKFSVIREEMLFETLVYLLAAQAFSEHIDRDAGGTIKIGYKIEADGLDEPFERFNYFYDEHNAVSFLMAEALPTAALIIFNNYREIKINKLTLDIEVTENRINASIDDAKIVDPDEVVEDDGEAEEDTGEAEDEGVETSEEAEEDAGEAEDEGVTTVEEADEEVEENETPSLQEGDQISVPLIVEAGGEAPPPDLEVKEFLPGEIVTLKVKLQPYREEAFDQELTIRIPRDFPEGSTSLIITGGGGLVSLFNEFGGKGTWLFPMSGGPLPLGPEILNIDEALEKIKEGETNNFLKVTIPRPPTPDEQQAEASGVSTNGLVDDEDKEVKVTIPTDYVIYDSYMIPIMIVKKKSNDEE